MKQKEIMDLLVEASNPDTTPQRTNAIQCVFCNAIKAKSMAVDDEDEARLDEQEGLLDKLFTETLEHRPRLLPSLYPFFAVVCGDTEYEIDWTLVQ
jgi:hypothetical protein